MHIVRNCIRPFHKYRWVYETSDESSTTLERDQLSLLTYRQQQQPPYHGRSGIFYLLKKNLRNAATVHEDILLTDQLPRDRSRDQILFHRCKLSFPE